MTGEVLLRNVIEEDLPIFYIHQIDPVAAQMADFPSREKEAFMAHWAKILADDSLVKMTVLYDGQVSGNVVCFDRDGEREVGYWIGNDYWGKGIATRALKALLDAVETRPLYAHVVKHNIGSQRVLEKCGFVKIREEGGDYIYLLDG